MLCKSQREIMAYIDGCLGAKRPRRVTVRAIRDHMKWRSTKLPAVLLRRLRDAGFLTAADGWGDGVAGTLRVASRLDRDADGSLVLLDGGVWHKVRFVPADQLGEEDLHGA